MGSHSAVCFFPPNDSSSVGHFPGNPIIPGAATREDWATDRKSVV